MITPAHSLIERLEGVRGSRPKWQARCPGHDDHKPSLSITEKANGDVLVFCHGPCGNDIERILSPIGRSPRDLFAENGNGHRDEEAVYGYVDEDGRPLFEVVRFTGKEFRQRLPDGSWGLNGARRVLYRLPRVREAVEKGEYLFVVEGERDVEALERQGQYATCNPGDP